MTRPVYVTLVSVPRTQDLVLKDTLGPVHDGRTRSRKSRHITFVLKVGVPLKH